MKKIVLLCNMGLSTSALMKKMRAYSESINYEVEVNAYPVNEAKEVGPEADCILIGPQISYQLDKVKDTLPDKAIAAIDMQAYGMMDGERVIEQAKQLMGE
ncbi:PTS sugar transporter subunit IIB [Enterococcus casseliflavus]|uniref:PTS sugar transporter subunit IIB n=1 Tax=Enterococcus casseliflavus TaxID=37734 RepID=UPI0018844445|nr:PTS sugar transporter subunit IIB [Enterococcus casseliflavus]MBE9909314.1 PTS sugar transporter subunit IIB [Enterococcus casseliflavus]